MPQKRKQQDDDVVSSASLPRAKRNKPSPTAPKRKAAEGIDNTSSSSPSKKVKYTAQSRSNARTNPSRTRQATLKRETQPSSTTPPTRSRLVPRGERKSAKTGQKDETLLRMLCDDTESGEQKELHFRNMLHSNINWNDVNHINKINNWRNQIYGRAGMKSKAVTVWLPDEELWFELYYQLSIAESRVHGMLLPKTLGVLGAFNKTFVGRVVQDHNGYNTAPRAERQPNAFASKFNRMCPELRARLYQSMFGKSGDIFVPEITLEMLHAYKQMRADMSNKGIEKESAYAVHLDEWCYLLANLPNIEDFRMQTEFGSTVEDDAAAAVLISMATQPVNARTTVTIEGEDDANLSRVQDTNQNELQDTYYGAPYYITPPQNEDDTKWSYNDEPSRAPPLTFSKRSYGRTTPPRSPASPDSSKENRSPDTLSDITRCATPACELDIASLIASPD
jgi:hypothetical protein